ncbi:hypothetical protein [Mycoplana ramosa]|uniref:MCE family protein n=1 Tax=Mycoplana ramosa TaxID=40837 RepID=A0ABW3YS90_MYCRA
MTAAKLLMWLGCVAGMLLLLAAQFSPDLEPFSPADGSRGVHPGRVLKVRIGDAAALNDINISLRKDAGVSL